MSHEMIAVAQRACEAWAAGDFEAFRNPSRSFDVVADGGPLWLETGAPAQGVDEVIPQFRRDHWHV